MSHFEIVSLIAWVLWILVAAEFIAFLHWDKKQALLFLEQVIYESKHPRQALHRHVPPPPPVVGAWEYDLPPKRLTQRPWFIP